MMEEVEHKFKKIVIVGDGTVGKSCLLYKFSDDYFPTENNLPMFEKREILTKFDDVSYLIELQDTQGQEDYDKLKGLAYQDVDCFLVCYSVDKPISLENSRDHWINDIREMTKNIPIVLCATKIDLRKTKPNCISTAEGKEFQKEINANSFVECSAKENIQVKEAINEAVRVSIVGVAGDAGDAEKKCNIL